MDISLAAGITIRADPDDTESWIAAIDRLLHEPELRADLVARGLQRAKAFSWRRIARRTWS
jgi:glycosyltransferase involved in cell wall biosynthesis